MNLRESLQDFRFARPAPQGERAKAQRILFKFFSLSLRDFEFIPFVFGQSASMMTGFQIIQKIFNKWFEISFKYLYFKCFEKGTKS